MGKPTPFHWFLVLLTVLLNLSALFVTILGPDGALYASIAKTMALRNDYVNLIAEGRDWLDKPHFPFWVSALFFEVFGFTTWAYKLPAILFLFAGAVYTYLLAIKLYDQRIAIWSVIILLTAEHIIISNNDVRAEPYLTGLIIGSVYHFYRAYTEKRWMQLVLGSLLGACAIMTKGPFAIIPIAAAIGGELLLKKRWSDLFHARWLVAITLIALFISPELYCLWKQFDSQPTKLVFGKTGVSGIRFFFWDSQFGRFFNTGPIRGKGDPLFFVHTLLWAFLPWSILAYVAIGTAIRKNIRKTALNIERLCLSGALITLLVFSLSRFQLPHYANIVFPFLSIIAAAYIFSESSERWVRFIRITQSIILCLLLIAPLLLHYFYRPVAAPAVIWIILIAIVVGISLLARITLWTGNSLVAARVVLASLFLNLYLNTIFYPDLMKYQAGSEAAYYINESHPQTPVLQFRKEYSYALEFYLDAPLLTTDSVGSVAGNFKRPFLLYGPQAQVDSVPGEFIKDFDYFPVSRLDGKFINHKTRHGSLKTFRLILVK